MFPGIVINFGRSRFCLRFFSPVFDYSHCGFITLTSHGKILCMIKFTNLRNHPQHLGSVDITLITGNNFLLGLTKAIQRIARVHLLFINRNNMYYISP